MSVAHAVRLSDGREVAIKVITALIAEKVVEFVEEKEANEVLLAFDDEPRLIKMLEAVLVDEQDDKQPRFPL